MNEETKIAFIPFHAINQFMRADFRLTVIRSTLLALPNLDEKHRRKIDYLTKKMVKVPGFRNSAKAPANIKAVAMAKPFDKEPKLVATILAAWAESTSELRQQTHDLLLARGWIILPLDFDRARLPGFLTRWPAEDDYEVLYHAFTEEHPQSEASIDEFSLMVVWLAGRLPVEKVNKEELAQDKLPTKENLEEETEA
jgi:hypothetical protein